MQWADTFVLVLPCGRSAHLELGWAAGHGKRTAILLNGDHEPELMVKMVDHLATDLTSLLSWLAPVAEPAPTRRTKRRFAHELYPHAGEFDPPRPLSIEVPYLYARMAGMRPEGSGWIDLDLGDPRAWGRIDELVNAARIALLADALAQGMAGDEAWAWADERVTDDLEVAWERAYAVLGDDVVRSIKPYPCGDEPTSHDHLDAPDARGWRTVHRIAGRESDCADCTEPIEGADEPGPIEEASR